MQETDRFQGILVEVQLDVIQMEAHILDSSARTSHPAGTTMRITYFLKYIPVRRQTALKDATKTLTKLKRLLQAYAFAHPTKRFSIKVLKAKNENNNWLYVPSADAEIADAAMRIVGRDVSSCCVVQKLPSESSDQSGYDVLAFLPNAGAGMQDPDHILKQKS